MLPQLTLLQAVISLLKRVARIESSLTNIQLLLGTIINGGTIPGAVGHDGDGFVFKNGGGYTKDPDTGKYHLSWTYSANGTIPPAAVRGAVGYTFATIPLIPVYA